MPVLAHQVNPGDTPQKVHSTMLQKRYRIGKALKCVTGAEEYVLQEPFLCSAPQHYDKADVLPSFHQSGYPLVELSLHTMSTF